MQATRLDLFFSAPSFFCRPRRRSSKMRRHSRERSSRLQSSRILALEKPFASRLANDGGLGGLIVIQTCVRARCVVALENEGNGDAAIRIRRKDPTGLVHGKVIEVQKVSRSAGASGSLRTDHPKLHS